MTRFALILSALAYVVIALPAAASSHKSNAGFADVSTLQLLPGWMRDDGMYIAAIQVDMAPGWKTYWREPGAGGIPPLFDWSRSRNLDQIGYFWPAPTVYDAYGTRTIGYEGRLILPVLMKPRDKTRPINAALTMDYGVCHDICVPVRGSGATDLNPDTAANQTVINQAVAARPRSGQAAGLTSATCALTPTDNDVVLAATLTFNNAPVGIRAAVVETGSEVLLASAADHTASGNTVVIEADLQNFGDGPMTINRQDLRFTLIGANDAIDVQGCTGG